MKTIMDTYWKQKHQKSVTLLTTMSAELQRPV